MHVRKNMVEFEGRVEKSSGCFVTCSASVHLPAATWSERPLKRFLDPWKK